MTCKLIFGNLKRNFKDYFIYFLTMMLSVGIFYAFNAATKPENLKSLGTDMLAIIGTLCFFYSISAVALMLAKKCKRFYYKDINSITVTN